MELIELSKRLRYLAGSNFLMAIVVILYLTGAFSELNVIILMVMSALGIIIFLIDLIFTYLFLMASWRLQNKNVLYRPWIYVFIVLSLLTRVYVLVAIFTQESLPLLMPISGASSIIFGYLLWTTLDGPLGNVHKELFKLIVVANFTGIGAFGFSITQSIFIGVKALLPLISAFIFFISSFDILSKAENDNSIS